MLLSTSGRCGWNRVSWWRSGARSRCPVGPGFATETYLQIAPAGEFRWIHAENAFAPRAIAHRSATQAIELTDYAGGAGRAAASGTSESAAADRTGPSTIVPRGSAAHDTAAAKDEKELAQLAQQVEQLKVDLSLLVTGQIDQWDLDAVRPARCTRQGYRPNATLAGRTPDLVSHQRIRSFAETFPASLRAGSHGSRFRWLLASASVCARLHQLQESGADQHHNYVPPPPPLATSSDEFPVDFRGEHLPQPTFESRILRGGHDRDDLPTHRRVGVVAAARTANGSGIWCGDLTTRPIGCVFADRDWPPTGPDSARVRRSPVSPTDSRPRGPSRIVGRSGDGSGPGREVAPIRSPAGQWLPGSVLSLHGCPAIPGPIDAARAKLAPQELGLPPALRSRGTGRMAAVCRSRALVQVRRRQPDAAPSRRRVKEGREEFRLPQWAIRLPVRPPREDADTPRGSMLSMLV